MSTKLSTVSFNAVHDNQSTTTIGGTLSACNYDARALQHRLRFDTRSNHGNYRTNDLLNGGIGGHLQQCAVQCDRHERHHLQIARYMPDGERADHQYDNEDHKKHFNSVVEYMQVRHR